MSDFRYLRRPHNLWNVSSIDKRRALIGDIGLIREVLDELQANPENQPFIERVNSYLDDFELMALQQFLAECQRDEAESWQNS